MAKISVFRIISSKGGKVLQDIPTEFGQPLKRGVFWEAIKYQDREIAGLTDDHLLRLLITYNKKRCYSSILKGAIFCSFFDMRFASIKLQVAGNKLVCFHIT